MKHILPLIFLVFVVVIPACVKKGQVNNQQTPSSIDKGTTQDIAQKGDMHIQANHPADPTCDGVNFYGQCAKLKGTITFGRYPQESDTPEPIEWRVLDMNDNGQILIISEKVLDAKPYNMTSHYIDWEDITIDNTIITWENSTIRSWLNGYDVFYNNDGINFRSDNFIDAAFTAEEQAIIVTSNVPDHPNPNHTTTLGNATTDRIFLLSIAEAQNYFSSGPARDPARRADATRYAIQKGVGVVGSKSNEYTEDGTCTDVHCHAYWWLRSPGFKTVLADVVYSDGSVFFLGNSVDLVNRGVRPALWVKL